MENTVQDIATISLQASRRQPIAALLHRAECRGLKLLKALWAAWVDASPYLMSMYWPSPYLGDWRNRER